MESQMKESDRSTDTKQKDEGKDPPVTTVNTNTTTTTTTSNSNSRVIPTSVMSDPRSVGIRCKCKVGRCHKCGSRCKRCGCDCDGVPPEVALARKPGGSRKKRTSQETPPDRPKRSRPEVTNYNMDDDPTFRTLLEMDKEIKEMKTKEKFKERQYYCDMMDLFDEPEYFKAARTKSTDQTSHTYKRMVSLASRICQKVVSAMMPGPSQNVLLMDVIECLNKSMKDSQQAKMFEKLEDKYDRIVRTICEVNRKAKKGTIERRICRAILHHALPGSELERLMKEYNFTFGNGSTKARAREDYQTLSEGKLLEKKQIRRQTMDEKIDEIVKTSFQKYSSRSTHDNDSKYNDSKEENNTVDASILFNPTLEEIHAIWEKFR